MQDILFQHSPSLKRLSLLGSTGPVGLTAREDSLGPLPWTAGACGVSAAVAELTGAKFRCRPTAVEGATRRRDAAALAA